jgi:hypothetical protein
MANPYETLGVSRTATPEEIRAAFRRLARLHHPDVNPSPTATEDFLRLAEAYRILSDRRLRAMYDEGLLFNREDYWRRKMQQRVVEQYWDNVMNELLRREEEETRARQIAVTTVVPLFLSAFLIALLRPPILESLGVAGWIVCLLLFALGVGELVKDIRFSLKYYTFEDDTISLMDAREAPDKPFTREEAWLFLIGGYLLSAALGWVVRYLMVNSGGMVGSASTILSLLLVPPAFVFLVARVRGLGIFEVGKIQVR